MISTHTRFINVQIVQVYNNYQYTLRYSSAYTTLYVSYVYFTYNYVTTKNMTISNCYKARKDHV